MQLVFFIKVILIILTSTIAFADEFLMLKNDKVNVRYGPSFEYPIKYVYLKKYLPIKVIDKKENFRRIIDHKQNSGWIHTSQLKRSSSVILIKNEFIFSKPTKFSEPIAVAEKGKLLLIKKCKKNWCKVKVEKFTGWVKKNTLQGRL